jgi:hypothetical protein
MDQNIVKGASRTSALVPGNRPETFDLSGLSWRKSTWSMGNGNCAEFAQTASGGAAVRDSMNRSGRPLLIAASGWQAFIQKVKCGCYDAL